MNNASSDGTANAWTPDSWTRHNALHQPLYPDLARVDEVVSKLRTLPPLVTSWEIERLKALLAEAQAGEQFVLQGGDCAETLADCTAETVTTKLKILLQMSLVLTLGAGKPVIRIGRIAGQYAKPRSQPTETRDAMTLPSYFGDLVNGIEFSEQARLPDPGLMAIGYQHAALTLNFIRALIDGGFADLRHPEYWDLDFCQDADLRRDYLDLVQRITESIRFMERVTHTPVEKLSRIEFFTSHEGLNLLYEMSGTRPVPRRTGYYNLTTHFPWIGERTRDLEGAHVEFFRGIRNPIGVKIGPAATPQDLIGLCDRLNPGNEPGRLTFIHRFGVRHLERVLPGLIAAVREAGKTALWICDPMHGNTQSTASGVKTRRFDDILEELSLAFAIHARHGSHLGGVHFELTGDPVTECVGGSRGLDETGLAANYRSPCDPRLNAEQSLEMAFQIARRLKPDVAPKR